MGRGGQKEVVMRRQKRHTIKVNFFILYKYGISILCRREVVQYGQIILQLTLLK